MKKFSSFLINEDRSYLGHKVGDVLTSVQDVQSDIDNIGSRHLSRMAENIVNQIRKILHSNWDPKYMNQLKELQKVAVAIQKTIEEKGDLKEILPAAATSLSTISGKLGVKVNSLNAPEQGTESDIKPQDFQQTPQDPQAQPQVQQNPQDPQAQPQVQ